MNNDGDFLVQFRRSTSKQWFDEADYFPFLEEAKVFVEKQLNKKLYEGLCFRIVQVKVTYEPLEEGENT